MKGTRTREPSKIVAEYKLYDMNRGKLEMLIHRIFAAGRSAIETEDRFSNGGRGR